MGLEDIAMFRSLSDSVVLYPSDAVSTEKLVEEAARHHGLVYIRTTRNATPVIYAADEEFSIGGCKVLKRRDGDRVTIVAAGITLHEALKAQAELEREGIAARVIDLYSIKPLDVETLRAAAEETGVIITVEDHYPAGGIGEAVCGALSEDPVPVYCLAVDNMPKSGPPDKLLQFEQISKGAIVDKVREILGEKPRSQAPETEVCTKAPEWAEHERLSDTDMPCDDGRSGKL